MRRPTPRKAAQKSTSSQVQEESLVQEPYRYGIGPADEQARAADPCDCARTAGHRLDPRVHGPESAVVRAAEPALPCLAPGAGHRAERQLGPAGTVDETRSDRGSRRVRAQHRDQRVDGPGGNDGVGIEKQDQFAAALAEGDVVGRAEAHVAGCAQEPHVRKSRAHHLGRPVGRSVVDDNDLVRAARRCCRERDQALFEVLAGVEGHNRNRQSHRPASSMARRVAGAASAHRYCASTPGAASRTRNRCSGSVSIAVSASATSPASGAAT